jgi:predicted acetyltransferase
MNDSTEVSLQIATPGDAELLSNLVQLYAYDLSTVFELELGSDGRYSYDKLPLYWSQPETRFPLLIRRGKVLAGFALASRGSPASDDPDVFDVAEFFVLRSYRRSGVGRKAAFLLWNRFPASWTVRVSEGNHSAQSFWSRIIEDYAGGNVVQTTRPGSPRGWQVFSFASWSAGVRK